jgi:hypothetical protein
MKNKKIKKKLFLNLTIIKKLFIRNKFKYKFLNI